MKKLTIITALVVSSLLCSQVIIGDHIGTASDKTSVLLEFSKTSNKGIILPYVTTLPQNPTKGTILLDASTSTSALVKYFDGDWKNWTGDPNYTADVSSLVVEQSLPENTQGKVIIGDSASSADGVLVLESTTSTMVLPTVRSTEDIVNPAPGMMVYVSNNKSGFSDKLLAVYNGRKWSFWSGDE